MQDWLKYGKGEIFNNKNLLSQFLKDYKEHFGGSINASCNKCLNKYYENYLNSLKMENKVKCDYELHAKYNGIQLGVNGDPIRNGEMTNEIAERLLKEHPRGALLFAKMPDQKEINPANDKKLGQAKPQKRTRKK